MGHEHGVRLADATQLLGTAIPATQFSAVLSNLASGVLYHFRAVVRNPDGTSMGADRTFTTGVPSAAHIASLSALSETYSVFTVAAPRPRATGQAAAKRHHKGTVFSFGSISPRRSRSPSRPPPADGAFVETVSPKPPSYATSHAAPAQSRSRRSTLRALGPTGSRLPVGSAAALKPGRYRAVFIAIDTAGTSRTTQLELYDRQALSSSAAALLTAEPATKAERAPRRGSGAARRATAAGR